MNGAPGRLVKENGGYVCRPREDMDAATVSQARRDAAYLQMVKDMENAWRTV